MRRLAALLGSDPLTDADLADPTAQSIGDANARHRMEGQIGPGCAGALR